MNEGKNRQKLYYLYFIMMPDYPHKVFGDKRTGYNLLMITLAMDSAN